ncbi:MAG: phosphoribulokinase [Deltaproteobacteria bacterium]|nr:phosphoribulokinase [Deltaproteobacteria bacterium]MBW2577029.1 phosphoribulokinase [Deltaproteobacteria bacterium]MBW2693408.1 phosphoribulokinase [Deltaproteobacteria bacterium]
MPENRTGESASGTSRVDRPVLLGIIGDSAAGKTTLATGIARILGDHQVLIICSDDYHIYSRAERAEKRITALHPDGNQIEILEQHLQLLRRNQPILKPTYNHKLGTLEPAQYLAPRPYIIVEGLLGYHTRAMRDCFDVKVFMEPDEELRIKWKLWRDCNLRGYTSEEAQDELKRREEDRLRFIQPQRTFSDIVINFYPPKNDDSETGAHLDVHHLLRPTLPHPDLSPLIEAGSRNGLSLELCRDRDGKPVDVLGISGGISDEASEGLENLLWEMLPEAQHMRSNHVGEFTDVDGKPRISHPLVLTELLVAYHMVKAAHGIHAI